MNKYEGLCCPVCHAKLFDDDEIVVCPDCGAPYHKNCYKISGKCVYAADHGTVNQWHMPKIEADVTKSVLQDKPEMPPEFKKPFNPAEKSENSDVNNENGESRRNSNGFLPHFAVLDDEDEDSTEKFVDNILRSEGVDKTEKIGEESSKNIALLVGYNAHRYLRIFKEMLYNKSKTGWNWIAFLLPQYWLLGRKCYKAGSLVTIFGIFTSLMLTILQGNTNSLYNLVTKAYANPTLFFTEPSLIIFMILLVITLIVHILIGLFGDYIYKKHIYSELDALHTSGEDDEMSLIKKGGVNMFVPIIVYFSVDIIVAIIAAFI